MTAYYVSQMALLILLVGIAWLMPALIRPTLPFGVRIPSERAQEPVIAAAVRDYRRLLLIGGVIVLAVILTLTVALGQPFLPTLGIFAALILCWSAYYRAHRQIAARKASERWYEGLRQGIVVDTSLRSTPPRFPFVWALPALAIVVITLALGIWRFPALPATLALHYGADGTPDRFGAKSIWSAFGPVVVQWAVTALLLGLAAVSGRFRADLDIEALEQSVAQHRRMVGMLQRTLLVLAACVALTFLGASALVWGLLSSAGPTLALITIVPILGIVGAFLLIVRAPTAPLAAPRSNSGGYVNRDDDASWRGGMFYVNRDDPALFVPKRFGIGWTINFAHPAAWLLLIVIVAIPAGISLLSAITTR
jgi:uncharacterized membrane protein